MRKTEGRRRVVWALALGWAFAGGFADPLAAAVPGSPPVGAEAPAEFEVEPVATTTAAVTTAASSTTTAAASTTTAAQVCGGSGFCFTLWEFEISFWPGQSIRSYCDICECTWVAGGRLHRTSWRDCGASLPGVKV